MRHSAAPCPRRAGTYEQELFPYLQKLSTSETDAVLDIGAAEGYYAVGLLFANLTPRVEAFECAPQAQALLQSLAVLNRVEERLELHSLCTPALLNQTLAKYRHPAILLDAEGSEVLLLDPLRVHGLERCRILVEYHDFLLHGIADTLRERFQGTHSIETILPKARTAADIAVRGGPFRLVPSFLQKRVIDEHRPMTEHGWLWLEPR